MLGDLSEDEVLELTGLSHIVVQQVATRIKTDVKEVVLCLTIVHSNLGYDAAAGLTRFVLGRKLTERSVRRIFEDVGGRCQEYFKRAAGLRLHHYDHGFGTSALHKFFNAAPNAPSLPQLLNFLQTVWYNFDVITGPGKERQIARDEAARRAEALTAEGARKRQREEKKEPADEEEPEEVDAAPPGVPPTVDLTEDYELLGGEI